MKATDKILCKGYLEKLNSYTELPNTTYNYETD